MNRYSVILSAGYDCEMIAEEVPLAKSRKHALRLTMAKHNVTPEQLNEAYVFKGKLPVPYIAETPPPIQPVIKRKSN